MAPLYACLRPARRSGDLPAMHTVLAVARDFSPRLHRYGDDCVVLDISGLGRLLGDPENIGIELASQLAGDNRTRTAADDRTHPHVAVAPTQLAAMMLSASNPGLTVVTADVELALATVPLAVLHQVVLEMDTTLAASATVERSAKSASREKSVLSASRKEPVLSASREKSIKSASREKSVLSATREEPVLSASREKPAKSASREKSVLSALHAQQLSGAFDTLARWGLATLGELAALPAAALSARLGQTGVALQRMAMGIDPRPLVPDPDVPRFVERIELDWPIDGLEPLSFVLARLLEPLSSALERADRGAAAIHLRLRLVDRTEHVRMLQLPASMRDPRVLRTLLVLDLESHPPHAAIDIVTIEIDPAPGRVIQYSLLERARPSAETVATLLARLGALVGDSRCGQPVLLDSDGPDAFAMGRFAPDETRAFTASARGDRTARAESAVLRRFRPPLAIRVTVERGRPKYVFVDRRGMPGGHVEQCAGPWRSSGAWWKDPDEVPAGVDRPWNRDEWDVALSDGSVCRLFQTRDREAWFLDGVID
jgi:nucleotidyltransferase/DNA polymerase involved in DNA repair